jgi:WD40 repeat protein
VTGIEIFRDSKNSANYPHKKQITALTVHPNKSVMCSASIDGLIKIWETETHTATAMFEETLDKKLKSAVTALCFHRSEAKKTTDILVTGTKSGRVQVWAVTPDAPPRVIGAYVLLNNINHCRTNLSQWITSIFFHPTLPCFFVLTAKGCLRAISVNHILNAKDIPTMKGLLSDFDMIQPLYVPLEDTTYRTNTKNLKTLLPVISATINEKNGQIAFFVCFIFYMLTV